MTPTAPIYVKHLSDDRVVEVIGGHVCIDGQPEADHLVCIDEHPNRQAILRAVPGATHVAGRLPLTMPQASVAQAARPRQLRRQPARRVRAAAQRGLAESFCRRRRLGLFGTALVTR